LVCGADGAGWACRAARCGGHSPSDFALVELSQGELDRLEEDYGALEDILPLSPLQEGLLFHALYDARGPDVYTVQLELTLSGRLDGGRLRAAAGALLDRHAVLRAGFAHEGLSRPVQVIVPRVEVAWRELDLSGLDGAERERQLAGFLAQDREQRFELRSAPLIRFGLVRLSGAEHRLVVSNHHLVLDGWSTPVLVEELLRLYGGGAADLPRLTPYRDYLVWLSGQDRAAAEAAWREALAGLEEATHIAAPDAGRVARVPEQVDVALSGELSRALSEQARRHGLTLKHLHPGGVGDPAGPADGSLRRCVRGDSRGAAA
jgi:hypothetical protein